MKKLYSPVLPYYGAAAVWLIAALFFKLYALHHFLLTAVISFGVLLFLRSCEDMGEPEQEEKKEEEKPSGNPELDKMMKDGQLAIAEMRRLNDAIEDETISAQIDRLEVVSGEIFKQVKADPKKLPQIRKFMDYYLPTTLKLLDARVKLDKNANTPKAREVRQRISEALGVIDKAFLKQFEALDEYRFIDLESEMDVLRDMLRADGLTGGNDEEATPLATH